jgi:hypothetical protein
MEDAGFATLSDDEEKDLPTINFGFVSIDELKKRLSGLAPAEDGDSSKLICCYHEIWKRMNLTKFKGEDAKKLVSYREKVRERILYWSNNIKAEQLEQAS